MRGISFTRHFKGPSTPNIAFRKERLAVFVDGNFWHGYNWRGLHKAPPKGFWRKKISRNMKQDKVVKKALAARGWNVVRVLEHQIEKNQSRCVDEIVKVLSNRHIEA